MLGKIPLVRGCLLFDALAKPLQLQVESKAQKRFWMASHDEDAHHIPRFGARRANLAQTLADVCLRQKSVSDFKN
jgi:hypothetical protein